MPKNLRRRGKIWWYRISHNKEDYEGSLETEDLGQAKDRLEGVKKDLVATNWGEKPKKTFNDMSERFAEKHFPNLKPKSRERYAVSIANLLEDFDQVKIEDIGTAKLGEFEDRRKAQGVTSSTVRRDLGCLSAMFTKAEEWEWAQRNPVKPFLRGRQMAGLEEGDPRTRYLSHEEEAEILENAPPKASKAFAVLIDTGIRKEEFSSLLRTDIDRKTRELKLRKEVTKSGKPRRVPLWERTWQIISETPADLKSPYLFLTYKGERYSEESPYLYQALQKAVFRANKKRAAKGIAPMEHVELHDLRRTCGCRLLQDHGFSMEEVSKWLGHSSVKVTEKHYAFLKEDRLRTLVEKREAEIVSLRDLGQKSDIG